MDAAVKAERERCAVIAEGLAEKWDASAASIRAKATRRGWFFGSYTYVAPLAERDAKCVDAAASGLRTVARLIREGAVRREKV